MHYFVDRQPVTLKNVRRTATGGLLVDATLARTGVLDYVENGKTIRRYNPEPVLAASLDGLPTAPVTNRHPRKFVDATSYRQVAAGHLVGQPRLENGHIVATLAIQDEKLIADVEAGRAREVSMGYLAAHDGVPGVVDGETYDEARTEITWNHVAIVPAGRAGKSVRLLLDSQDIPSELEDEDKMTIKIGDKELTLDAAGQAELETYLKTQQDTIDSLTAARDAANQLVLAHVKRAEEAEAKLAIATSDETISKAVEAELAKRAAKAQADEKLAKVKAAYPTLDLEGKSEAYIDGLAAAMEAKPADAEGLNKIQSKDAKPVESKDAAPVKRESHAERLAREAYERSRAPLAPEKV